MGIATWLLGLVSRPIVTNAASRLDGWLALRARVMHRWHMWSSRHERPEGYVLCPICYGSETHASGPCPFCLISGKPREAAGYVTPYYFSRHWDSPRWKPRREWAGFHITRPLPEAVVQDWTPRAQRTYREGLDAPYRNWRTPYKAG
jgi:hypothetical protein